LLVLPVDGEREDNGSTGFGVSLCSRDAPSVAASTFVRRDERAKNTQRAEASRSSFFSFLPSPFSPTFHHFLPPLSLPPPHGDSWTPSPTLNTSLRSLRRQMRRTFAPSRQDEPRCNRRKASRRVGFEESGSTRQQVSTASVATSVDTVVEATSGLEVDGDEGKSSNGKRRRRTAVGWRE
jgi:hypothetical protein